MNIEDIYDLKKKNAKRVQNNESSLLFIQLVSAKKGESKAPGGVL